MRNFTKALESFMDKSVYNISFSLLSLIFIMYLLSCTGFIFHIPINICYPIIAIISSFCLYIYLSKKQNLLPQNIFYGCLFIGFFLVIAGIVSSSLWDSSYDGRWYHQTDILLLSKGWNPVYTSAQEFIDNTFKINVSGVVWIQHYTKFVEICAANVLVLTHRIEAGKILNLLFAFILFGFSYKTLINVKISEKNILNKILIAFILVINPVLLCQMFTYYLDGILYCLYVIILLSLFDISISKTCEKISFLSLLFSTVMILNIKFGAFLLVICTFLVYIIYFILLKNFDKLKYILLITVFASILCCISGINPYYTNIKSEKHILYPVFGTDIARKFFNIRPIGFNEMNIPQRFFISIFSKVEWQVLEYKYEIKFPFSVYKKEFVSMAQPDPQLSGFGVFSSGYLILSMLLLLNLLLKKDINRDLLPIYLSIILTIILNPSNFYARYVPQLFAFIWLILVNYQMSQNKTIISKCIYTLTVLTIIINSSIVLGCAIGKSIGYYTIPIKNQLKNIKQAYIQNKEPISIYLTHEISFLQKLKEQKIKYILINKEQNLNEYNAVMPSASSQSGIAGLYWK